jgi:hypothetical protein
VGERTCTRVFPRQPQAAWTESGSTRFTKSVAALKRACRECSAMLPSVSSIRFILNRERYRRSGCRRGIGRYCLLSGGGASRDKAENSDRRRMRGRAAVLMSVRGDHSGRSDEKACRTAGLPCGEIKFPGTVGYGTAPLMASASLFRSSSRMSLGPLLPGLFLPCSIPRLLSAAPGGGLEPSPARRFRGASPHRLLSCAKEPPVAGFLAHGTLRNSA